MRVAYVCADPGIPVFGYKGASIHIQGMLREMLNAGMDVTLFTCRGFSPVPEEFRAVRVVPLFDLSGTDSDEEKASQALRGNQELKSRLVSAGPFDVVYERYSLWSFAGMEYARNAGIPGILEVNAPLPLEQKRWRKMVMEHEAYQVLELVLEHASTVIAVSPGIRRWLETLPATEGKVHVVRNGVNPTSFYKKNMARGSVFTVVFSGTLKPWHGMDTLAEAFILLRRQRTDISLSIIGDGPERPALENAFRSAGVDNAVVFHGGVAHCDVPALLACADAGVAPYPHFDDFYFSPLKIYEYMAAELPVITSRTGDLDRIVKHEKTGLLIPPESPSALSDAIITLADSPSLCRKMGEAGGLYVKQNSWENVLRKIWLYADITLLTGGLDEV
ncbi:glycosyltransferase family 4 protein [Escherichia coli]|uniref:glycosyltransferase family 4 protein n=1 Tax=Escherichia coli TaxID=562 RepID=UPI00107710B9|nr:glycosyltransferase family 4 protein [Escherichia coli]HDQ6571574.1 glycosyltransferase family 4 protein [Escherichia coli Ou:H7]EEC7658192.1 glycosyltransferase family 4 protein [Escherichia coli]EET2571720.1 glycosyltransferase family 4 protein [Escherichia coli]EEW8238055.1 glycosyltransferase family 4 protein [Escherichia coli]EFM9370255.1 glycosyltransferase family 4 protein [Escherichia coli]